jgi:hypothetical protein
MYGLPPDTQIDFLQGKTLLQACFGANDLILNFTENISISIFSAIGVGLKGSNVDRHSKFEEVSRELLRLLNRVVAEVHWTPEGTVSLIFDEGSAVYIYDDSAGYESYTIAGPSGLLVV